MQFEITWYRIPHAISIRKKCFSGKKMYTSDNRISYSLSRLVLNRFAAIGSQYNGCGHLGDSQLGDNIFPAFHYTFLGLYQHIHFGVIRYTVALTIVPPHTSPTVLQPPKYCVGELRSNKVPKLPLTVLDSLHTLHSSRWVKNKKTPRVGTCWSRKSKSKNWRESME